MANRSNLFLFFSSSADSGFTEEALGATTAAAAAAATPNLASRAAIFSFSADEKAAAADLVTVVAVVGKDPFEEAVGDSMGALFGALPLVAGPAA